MQNQSKKEYITLLRERYRFTCHKERKLILDELCTNLGYHRKHAIRLLNSTSAKGNPQHRSKRGPKHQYDDPLILEVILDIWRVTNLPCSKRLKAILPLWLPYYEALTIPEPILQKLHQISAATIDRLMRPMRAKYHKLGLATTKPGSIIKKHIPIKTNQWDESVPGFIEADTVAHCGNSTAGMFIYTLNCVDIATGWTEQRAVWGKGERGVKEAIESIEKALPFTIKGFDCDNGSEFLNWHLIRFFTERKQPVQFTRSRAYHKNDNAHIENKNWTHIRQYLGYQRIDKIELLELMNILYQSEWNDYFNFFIPSVKLIEKKRIGSKIIKKHDKPKTPYQRIIESDLIDENTKQKLKDKRKTLNPFILQKQMKTKIKLILKLINNQNQ